MASSREITETDLLRKKAEGLEEYLRVNNVYRRKTLEELATWENEIAVMASRTNQSLRDILEVAGIKEPYQLLQDAIQHWDRKLHPEALPSESELVRRLQEDFKLHVRKTATVYVPPDDLKFPDAEESSLPKEEGDDVNRVSLALSTLLHLTIKDQPLRLEDLEVTVGEVPEHSARTRPYWCISIKPFKVGILVSNQYGNRTFVFPFKTKKDFDQLVKSGKEQLKVLSDEGKLIHHFIFEEPATFQAKLAEAIVNVVEKVEMLKPYPTYEEAKAAVQQLHIRTQKDYRKRYKEDARLSSNPDQTYRNTFVSWPDFLRNEGAPEYYSSYVEAKVAVQNLKINSEHEYRKRYKKDPRLTSIPDKFYKDDFVSWGHFLRNEKLNEFYGTYSEAKQAVQALGIRTHAEYKERYKEDSRLTSIPKQLYKASFVSWKDFFRNEPEHYSTYAEAKLAVQALGIQTAHEYKKRYKEDPRLPSNPDRTYQGSFLNWEDFLRNGEVPEFYSTYHEAKLAVQTLGIRSLREYRLRKMEDSRLPSHPHDIYKQTFIGYGDFLRNEPRLHTDYETAKQAVQILGIRTVRGYGRRYKEDPRLPRHPDRTYKGSFVSWDDFLRNEQSKPKRKKVSSGGQGGT